MTTQTDDGDQARQPLLGDAAETLAPDEKAGPPLCSLTAGKAAKGNDSQKTRNKLILALVLCFIFMIVEVVGGILANSLAVMTDAAHLLSDFSGFAIALFANFVASQSNKETHTFGYHRVEVLGALVSVLSTWLVTGILIWEAVLRVINRKDFNVNGKLMFILALVGVLVNALNFFVLGHHGHSHSHSHDHDHEHEHDVEHGHSHEEHDHDHDHEHEHGGSGKNINLQGAVLHVIGDLVQSIGVAVAGLVIWLTDKPNDGTWNKWNLVDPVCTFVFAILVLLTTRVILRDIADILMERVPRGQNAQLIQEELEQVEDVAEVHDLHIWALTPGIPLLAVHLNLTPGAVPSRVLMEATQVCRKYKIEHSTIQVICHGEECCGTNLSHSYRALYSGAGEEPSELSRHDGHHRHSHGSGQGAGPEHNGHRHHAGGSSRAGHTHKHDH